jgi:septal ring factor EnvC (AmiA/AmiB activator)
MQAHLQQTEQSQTDVQQQLAKLNDDVAARNKDLAALGIQLRTARQEVADTQANLAALQQELTNRAAGAANEEPNARRAPNAAPQIPEPDAKSESYEAPK